MKNHLPTKARNSLTFRNVKPVNTLTFGKKVLFFLFTFFAISFYQAQSPTTFTTVGTSTWTVPAGVTSIQVEAWGAGGAGGNGGSTNKDAGGGGGGGAYSKLTTIMVNPGTSYSITVGAGGIANQNVGGNGGNGGNSTVTFGATTIITASGGNGGLGYTAWSSGGTGAVGGLFAGGNGAAGNSVFGIAGGGGEGAATNAKGANANGCTGGNGTDGGNGASYNNCFGGNFGGGTDATTATGYGGGGSGSVKNFLAGAGASGAIKITFTCPTFSAGSNQTLATCATTATLAATAATAPATGAWTVVSGTGTVTTPTSATSGVTGIVPGTPLVLRWTVTNGRCGSTSSDVTINSPVGPGCLTYCAATGNTDCLSNDYISNVTYNTINNSTTCNAGGYTIFPKSGVQTTSVIKGASYNFSLSVGPGSGNHGAGVWIDFNQNGSFSDAGEFFLVSNAIVPSSITNIPILIPTGAATGDVRMRVRYAYSTTVVSGMSCAMSGTFGETEDYTITVLPAVPITVTSSENLPICRDVSTTLSATSTASPAYSYTWSPASGLNTTTGATVIATPSQTTTYTVTGTNGTSGSVQKITVTVSPTPKNYTIQQTISPSGATACSEDYVKLDVLGMPPMVPFEEKVTPLNNSWTKFGLSDGPPTNNFYAVDIVVSNTVLAGGSASEFQFKRVSNGYNSDWYITPNSGLPANYLPISLDGYSAANLTFKSRFVALNNTFTRNIYMEVSTDAINWDILWSTLDIANNDNIAATPVLNLATYLGSKVYIRFRYSGDSDGLDTWSLDDIKITGTIPPVSWSPNTGLYTDATLTTAYTGGDVTTLYAAPNGSQLYTLSTSISPCSKSTTSTVVHTKKKFTATSGNWSNNNNWFPAGSPISPTYIDDRCVNIPNGKSVVVDVPTAIAKSVTVDAGGKLTIISKQALTVTDAIGNNSGETNFIVENDANLLQVNDAAVNTGSITVKRNAYMKRQDYTYWGSPVQNQNLKAFSPNTLSSRFYTYNESTDLFVSITPESNSFIPGQGYAVRSPNNFPADNLTYQNFYGAFTGVPTNGTSWTDASSVTRNIVFPLKKVGNGYNLIANPYPSNFDFELLKNLNSTKINFLAYFWTNINHNPAMQGTNYPNGGYVSNYATLNGTMGTPATYSYTPQNPNNGAMLTSQTPNQYIKVGQGFIVKSLVNNQDLIFNNSVRKANNSSIFFNNKTADSTAVDRFWIQLTTPLNVVTTAGIGYKQEATNDFELDYDAPLMGLGSDAIFTVLDTQRLGIQGRKYPLNVNDVIPLGTNHYAAGSYTIAVPIAEGIFANGQNIYLKDNQTNTITNLSDGNYTFTANQGLTEGRFEIIYQPGVVLGTGASTKENLIVYREGNDFVVKSSLKKITGLEVYDASGKLIVKTSPNKNEVRLEGNTWLNGIYVLKINQNGEITTKKVMR